WRDPPRTLRSTPLRSPLRRASTNSRRRPLGPPQRPRLRLGGVDGSSASGDSIPRTGGTRALLRPRRGRVAAMCRAFTADRVPVARRLLYSVPTWETTDPARPGEGARPRPGPREDAD